MRNNTDKIQIENVNSSGHKENVDRDKYEAMKDALLSMLHKTSPGLTVAEAKDQLLPLLPQTLFPEGAKAGWWLKATQLDLEPKALYNEKIPSHYACAYRHHEASLDARRLPPTYAVQRSIAAHTLKRAVKLTRCAAIAQ